ncbi:MAG: ABC transporter permease [Bryobacteraceae bacterium]
MRDLHFGLRQFARSPVFSMAAVVSLAFGIGANTAIFSLLNALLFRPLAVRAPQQLIRIGPEESDGSIGVVPGGMLDWLRRNPLLDGVCGAETPLTIIELNNEAIPAGAVDVSGDCYQTLGVNAALGRTFTLADDIPNGPRVAMLSYSFWREKFGGNQHVLGQAIRIEGVPFTIIGVTEPRFQGLLLGYPPMISFPISQEINPRSGDTHAAHVFYWAFVFARLKPGASPAQVRASLAAGWRRNLDRTLPPSFKGRERDDELRLPPAVAPGATGLDYTLRNRYRQSLVALLAVSGLLLLVACLNVANLLLARGLQRRGEIAVRLALGATRWQIIRQLAIEGSLLLVAGVGLSIAMSYGLGRFLAAILSRSNRGLVITVAPDARVLLFTASVALIALLVSGLLPAWQTSGTSPVDGLKNSSRSLTGANSRSRRLLVTAQVAFALVLVTASSAFIETLRHLRSQRLGFETDVVLNAQLMPLPSGYAKGFTPSAYHRDLLDRMRALPGVESVSLSDISPLFTTSLKQAISRKGQTGRAPVQSLTVLVSDGFLATMRIPLLAGSDFSRSDPAQGQKKAIVSQSLAERLFPPGDVLGKHVSIGTDAALQDVEIVGIAANARLVDPRSTDTNFVYLDFWQQPQRAVWGNLQIRYSGKADLLIPAVRNALREAGHEYALHLRTIGEQRDFALLREKLLATLGTAFGALTLTLVTVGLFGLLAFFVAARTNEIGIRMALGADRLDVNRLVLREAFLLTGTGIAIGIPLSYASERALSGLLYGSGRSPIETLLAPVALLLLAAAIAAYLPARRATAVDPMASLRHE